MFSVNSPLQSPHTITLPVDHHPVKFEIDTGSAVTLINEASLQKLPSLLPASSTFRRSDALEVSPVGRTDLQAFQRGRQSILVSANLASLAAGTRGDARVHAHQVAAPKQLHLSQKDVGVGFLQATLLSEQVADDGVVVVESVTVLAACAAEDGQSRRLYSAPQLTPSILHGGVLDCGGDGD
ncbi:hypothetical protein SprV_0100298200 [Sparganum proliferum]